MVVKRQKELDFLAKAAQIAKRVLPGFFSFLRLTVASEDREQGDKGMEKRKIRIKRYALIVNANTLPCERQLGVKSVR